MAYYLARHETELRADLQRLYGMNLDAAMCGGATPEHVAALVHHLPPDSCLGVAMEPDNAWTLEATMLAAIFNSIQLWQWSQSDKKRRGAAPPKVGPSWMQGKGRKLDAQVMTVAQLMRELKRSRKEVQHG